MFSISSTLLDVCVLSILETEETYGYVLTMRVMSVLDVSQSTLYPVLRRLQKEGYLTTYDREFQGRNRRYYKITEYGKDKLVFYREEWIKYKEKIDKIMLEGIVND